MGRFPRLLVNVSRLFAFGCFVVFSSAAAAECVPVGQWIAPGAKQIAGKDVLARAAARRVVLLGESHDNAEHHRWQLHTIAALHALRPDMALAFEMFPRRVQPALDRWVAGELNEADFLAAAEWRKFWTFDPSLYMPIFHFARMQRMPMRAINVEHSLTREVGKTGFDGVPAERREGVTRPAPATEAYIERLLEVYGQHDRGKAGRNDLVFRRFVESQLVWDRAMAEGIAAALDRSPKALVVGVIGGGHLSYGHGVAHQLRDLGVNDVMTLLPWDRSADCAELVAGLADAVFGVSAPAATQAQRQRLGVALETTESGVVIRSVEKDSVAEAAGLRSGDVFADVAGRPARQAGDIVEAVQRQAPGTWLPIKVKRQSETLELVAKFPPLAR